jgi:transposase
VSELPVLPPAIRAGLPPEVQAYLAFLEDQILVGAGRIGVLETELAAFKAQLPDLLARIQQHSGNSSRPPSTDPPSAPPRPKSTPSGRKRGGQVGHPGHTRIQLSPADLTGFVDHRPATCPGCLGQLPSDLPTEGEPRRQQIWEVPVPRPEIIEHRAHRVRCPHCDLLVPAPALPPSSFGPQLTAITSVLHGRYRLSVRETAGIVEDLFGVPIGVGSIPTVCQEISRAVEPVCRAVAEQIRVADHVNVDETGWKQAGARRWLWTAVAAQCTLFLVAAKRDGAVLPTLLGENFVGRVTSDRYGVYRQIPVARRQVCLAHLQRNLAAFAERGGTVGDWGKEFRATIDQVFAAWHVFTDEGRDRARLIPVVAPLQVTIHSLLEHGKLTFSWNPLSFCKDVSALEPALWTFVTTEGVEPTNNPAERALRPAVLWRKGCFGADSDTGNVFVARILTVRETCRQQHQHLLRFLTDTLIASRHGLSSPPRLASP